MAKIRLYGHLKRFGSEFDLEVRDTAEAIRALCAQIPQFRTALQQGWYKVRIGKEYLDNRFIEKGMFYRLGEKCTIHITPVIQGAKKNGVFQTILGAVLVVVGVVLAYTPLAAFSGNVISLGVAMMVGGVAQMLTKSPEMNTGLNEKEKKQSTSFSNLSNLIAQGRPVPLAYGQLLVGSLIISQGVETFDVESAVEKVGKAKAKSGSFRSRKKRG